MLRARTLPAAPPLAAPPSDADPLLDAIGPLVGLHVLVIGHDALETMCALLRGGCASATEVRGGDRLTPGVEAVDAVIVPRVANEAQARDAVARAGRALSMGGQIALRDVSGELRQILAGLLRTHGFVAMRVRMTRAGAIVSAERPIFGPLSRA